MIRVLGIAVVIYYWNYWTDALLKYITEITNRLLKYFFYPKQIGCCFNNNGQQSTLTLFTLQRQQTSTHAHVTLNSPLLPLKRRPCILGSVLALIPSSLPTWFTRSSSRINVLKTIAGTYRSRSLLPTNPFSYMPLPFGFLTHQHQWSKTLPSA